MIYCYLFEAKSIQSYLFESGKLKDVISASERLDRLVDTNTQSVLFHVLNTAALKSDLIPQDKEDENQESEINTEHESDEIIHFLRCKGGAFYCYARSLKTMTTFRSLWTLTLLQMFPSLEYVDSLTNDETLPAALDEANKKLAADRNTPKVKFPIATTPTKRYSRTGKVSVPISALANQAAMKKEIEEEDGYSNAFDIDTEYHRQAYQSMAMRNDASLQKKFIPENISRDIKVSFPINLDKEFQFENRTENLTRQQREASKDIALIHIDGNGLGILLRALRIALKASGKEGHEEEVIYRKAYRLFSDALCQSTEIAAKYATQYVYDHASYEHEGKTMLPMRPIVLGGDDITLLCRADLALEFSELFCLKFKEASESQLKPLFNHYLKNYQQNHSHTALKPYLTASGGILYHKAGHPFTHSHHLVEHLCSHAKKLTKSVNKEDSQVGPAAIAFHRLSNAIHDDFDSIVAQSLVVGNDAGKIQLGQAAYFIESETENNAPFTLEHLKDLAATAAQKDSPVSISRWRQMATHLAMNDFGQAERVFFRGWDNCTSQKQKNDYLNKIEALMPEGMETKWWYWKDENGDKQTIINDLLIINHFSPAIAQQTAEETLS